MKRKSTQTPVPARDSVCFLTEYRIPEKDLQEYFHNDAAKIAKFRRDARKFNRWMMQVSKNPKKYLKATT